MIDETHAFNMDDENDTMYDEGDDADMTDEDGEEKWDEEGLEEEGSDEQI